MGVNWRTAMAEPIPTESRIFAARYARETKRLEQVHAQRLHPGAKTWQTGLRGMCNAIPMDQSPKKAALVLKNAMAYLNGVPADDRTYFMLGQYNCAKRSAHLQFATISTGSHLLRGIDEEGFSIMAHMVAVRRNGSAQMISNIPLAQVSLHTVSRLHQRAAGEMTNDWATVTLSLVGALGHVLNYADHLANGQLALNFNGALVVGSLHPVTDGTHGGMLFNVRTVLPADEVKNQALLDQGAVCSHVVSAWIENKDQRDIEKLVAKIPFVPARDDYTMRAAIPYQPEERPHG
jgi:hypothetical protein